MRSCDAVAVFSNTIRPRLVERIQTILPPSIARTVSAGIASCRNVVYPLSVFNN